MFCPKCGNEVKDGTAFCGNCGASLNGGAGNAAGANTGATPTPVANAAAPGATGSAAPKKKKTGLIIGIVVVIVAIIVVVVGVTSCGGSGVAVKDSTEAYTWDELSKISGEIAGASDENKAVEIAKKYHLTTPDGKLDGNQTKSVTLSNGVQTSVQIAGFAHDEKADGGKAGITFIFKDCIGEHVMNSSNTNAGGWEASQMRSWLNSDVLNQLPTDLKNKVVKVNKLTNNTGETQSPSFVTKTQDSLWLFSFKELAGDISQSDFSSYRAYVADIWNAEGAEYKLFRDAGVTWNNSNDILRKTYNGSSYTWWERSARPSYSNIFENVNTNGNPSYRDNASGSYAVVPGFCI